jgi:hypothetical protein
MTDIKQEFKDLLRPEQLHRLALMKKELNKFNRPDYTGNLNINPVFLYMISADLDDDLVGRDNRISFYRWAFERDDIEGTKSLTSKEAFGLLVWAAPQKPDNALKSDHWRFSNTYYSDLEILAIAFSGKISLLPIAPPVRAPRATMDENMKALGYE